MSRTGTGHETRSHAALLEAMALQARWRSHDGSPRWDPTRPVAGQADHGRGLLDAFALALHVLWTYQQAWADECFLPTAQLPTSVRSLLALIGYHPHPGFAAVGLQHFRCKEGAATTLPPRFRVTAAAAGERPAATFETSRAIAVSAEINEMRPFLPPFGAAQPTTGAIAAAVELYAPEVAVPLDSSVLGASSFADSLGARLAAARTGALAARNAARARQQALRVAEVLAELREAGAADICGESYETLCQQLCQTQALANQVPDAQPGPLSESQELLIARLRGMALRQPHAVAGLESALARCAGESDAAYSARLDQLMAFLDALVTGILQEARDQVVRLRGSRALTMLDASLRPPPSARGVAAPGTDSLYLLPIQGDGGPRTHADLLRPGDWLVLAEDIPGAGRVYREAVQVLRLRDEIPPGQGESVTRLTIRPPLARRYQLDNTVIVGNVAPISHGQTTEDRLRWSSAQNPFGTFSAGPLGWLQSIAPDAAEGRVPQVEVTAASQPWTRVTDLRGVAGTATAFAVEILPDGGSRMRFGDGTQGIPDGADVTIRYRTGIGESGNRPAGAVDKLADADAALVGTLNPLPVTGGLEPEPAELSLARANAGVHALDRAISVADVASLALTFGGVQGAKVFRDPVRRRDHLTLVVVGLHGAVVGEPERARLRSYLVARMPPGATVRVEPHGTVQVAVRLRLRVVPGSDPLAVIREVRVRLGVDQPAVDAPLGLLHPDRAGLGRDLNASDLYGALAGVSGLASVFVESLHRSAEPPGRADRVAIPDDAVAVWARAVPGASADLDGVQLAWEEATDL